MKQQTKQRIKGFAKTTGKYALKGIGKTVELAGRSSIQVVDSLVKNPETQQIATAAGLLGASVMIPTVGIGLIGVAGLKYLTDKAFLGKNKDLLDEFWDIFNFSNGLTRNVCDNFLSPGLNKTDEKTKNLGDKFQAKVDDLIK